MPDPDVVVVGAGLAGLTCARRLAQAGLAVAVVEARDRLGGRVHGVRDADGWVVELGAQVVHGDPLPDLAARPASHPDLMVVLDDVRHDPRSLAGSGIVAPWMVQRQMLSRPRPAGMTVDTIVGVLPDRAARVAEAWFEQVWGASAAELDIAEVAEAQQGRGTSQWSPTDGFGAFVAGLAAGLDVRLDTPVRTVDAGTGAVELGVEGPGGPSVLHAARVVLTVPPPCAVPPSIGWSRPPEPERLAAAARLGSGPAAVAVLTADRVARRDAQLLLADPPHGLWSARAGCRTVVGHLKGPRAVGARIDGSAVRAVLRWLVGDRAEVAGARVVDWTTDPWAGGGYSLPRPGATAAALAWARPAPPLYFAGEATAGPRRRGRMQGALASGVRAADEVLAGHSSSTG